MGTRSLGRKATVFAEGIQVLKAEWFYRPAFVRAKKVLTLSASSRRSYIEDKFQRAKADIQTECYKNRAPKSLLGVIK